MSRTWAAGLLAWGLIALTAGSGRALAADPVPKTGTDAVPYGYKVIEEDIVVPIGAKLPDQFTPMGTYDNNQWPFGIVYYEFDANVTQANQNAALSAMAQWTVIGPGNISFNLRSNESDYIHIQNATVNNSPVGRQGGKQIVNIVSWGNIFTISHELGHALGFWHEQSRADRNSYIMVNLANVCQTCCPDNNNNPAPCDDQFAIRSSGGEWGPYDFDSVMHYGQCSFIAPMIACPGGGTTITVLSPNQNQQGLIGQRSHLSYLDKTVMSFLYALPTWTFADVNWGGSQSGTFRQPYSSFSGGINGAAINGTLWLAPGSYSAVGTWNQPVIVRAALGATLGN